MPVNVPRVAAAMIAISTKGGIDFIARSRAGISRNPATTARTYLTDILSELNSGRVAPFPSLRHDYRRGALPNHKESNVGQYYFAWGETSEAWDRGPQIDNRQSKIGNYAAFLQYNRTRDRITCVHGHKSTSRL